MPNEQQPTGPIVLSFFGPIEHQATKYLRNWCCQAQNQKRPLTILMSSWGGNIHDGIALHNLIRGMTVPVTMVNMGTVESIAVAIFLAGSVRIACPNSRFLLHDFLWTFGDKQTLTSMGVRERDIDLQHHKNVYRDLLTSRTNLTDARLDDLKLFQEPIILDAAAAKEAGIVKEVTQYAIPAGTEARNIDW